MGMGLGNAHHVMGWAFGPGPYGLGSEDLKPNPYPRGLNPFLTKQY